MDSLELEMRSALGLQRYKKAKEASYSAQKWKVVLSVRKKKHGAPSGVVFRFEHTASCLGIFDAEMQAREAARKSGLVVWAVLALDVV